MYCGCRGLLLHFTAQLIRWAGLRAERPNIITLDGRCPVCGREWSFQFTAKPAGAP